MDTLQVPCVGPGRDSTSASHKEIQKPASVFPGWVCRKAVTVLCALFAAVQGHSMMKYVLPLGEKLSALLV